MSQLNTLTMYLTEVYKVSHPKTSLGNGRSIPWYSMFLTTNLWDLHYFDPLTQGETASEDI